MGERKGIQTRIEKAGCLPRSEKEEVMVHAVSCSQGMIHFVRVLMSLYMKSPCHLQHDNQSTQHSYTPHTSHRNTPGCGCASLSRAPLHNLAQDRRLICLRDDLSLNNVRPQAHDHNLHRALRQIKECRVGRVVVRGGLVVNRATASHDVAFSLVVARAISEVGYGAVGTCDPVN
jgi:hypothetical protein